MAEQHSAVTAEAAATASTSRFDDEAMATMFGDLGNPQPNYRTLLEEGGFFQPMDGFAMSFRRETTEYVLRHHELFTSAYNLGIGNVRPLIPLNVDPPQHSKYRKLLDPLFAPKRMDEQEADISRRINSLIDEFISRGECNFTEDFAEIFPSSVFLGLMGLPEAELTMFLHLRDGILHAEKVDPAALTDPEARQRVQQETGQQIYDYFGDLVDERTKHPTDDVISGFVQHEIDGERLSRDDILDICYLFLIAGLDTVSDSLTCFFAYLAQHPDQRQRIVDDPSIIPTAVEELLRWESPVASGVPRIATEDVVLPTGETIKAGTAVRISYGAANLDESAFGDPFEVRLDRPTNPHIAFGGGVHRCLGSHLARRELRATLLEWHKRIPTYRIKPGHENLEWPHGLRHVKDLMLSWA